jgi:translocation and assembly module TamB
VVKWGTQKSGQLRVRNFPVNVLENFIQLPVPITGELNATATVAGDLQNPRALGDLELTDGTLNQSQSSQPRLVLAMTMPA